MCSWVQKATNADLQDSNVPMCLRAPANSVISTPAAMVTDLHSYAAVISHGPPLISPGA